MNEHKTKSTADLTAFLLIVFIALCFAGLTGAGIVITKERQRSAEAETIGLHSHDTAAGSEQFQFHIVNEDTAYVTVKTEKLLVWDNLNEYEKMIARGEFQSSIEFRNVTFIAPWGDTPPKETQYLLDVGDSMRWVGESDMPSLRGFGYDTVITVKPTLPNPSTKGYRAAP
jgi:hypothetical protein